jgi:hypothetical protein
MIILQFLADILNLFAILLYFISVCCVENALMDLNDGKCKSITFSELRHPVKLSYKLGSEGVILDRVISDLGVIMGSRMSFAEHVDIAVGMALTMLGL